MAAEPAAARGGWLDVIGRGAILARQSAAEAAAIVAVGLLPGALLTLLAASAAGLLDAATLQRAIVGEEAWRLAPAAAARAIGAVVELLATYALFIALDARRRGRPLGARASLEAAAARSWPFLLTMARACLWIGLGLLLFVLPGLAAAAAFAFAPAAVAADQAAGAEALRRSRALVLSAPAATLGPLAATCLAAGAAGYAAMLLLNVAFAFPEAVAGAHPGVGQWQLMSLAGRWAGGVLGAWPAAVSLLIYAENRG